MKIIICGIERGKIGKSERQSQNVLDNSSERERDRGKWERQLKCGRQ